MNENGSPSGRLAGRVAVVTGASSGNGRATALALARAGAAVACSDLRPDRLAHGFEDDDSLPTHEQILAAGGQSTYRRADVTSPDDMQQLGRHAVDEHGRIDIWVNNAGIVTASPIEAMPIEEFNRELAVDVTGTWLGCKVAARAMRGQEKIGRSAGHIINLGSIAGSFGNANITAYAAAKGAVHSMTRALATELGPDGINVNAVLPGFLPTAMNRAFWDDPAVLADILGANALTHPGQPDDVANAIVFLASEEAAWIRSAAAGRRRLQRDRRVLIDGRHSHGLQRARRPSEPAEGSGEPGGVSVRGDLMLHSEWRVEVPVERIPRVAPRGLP